MSHIVFSPHQHHHGASHFGEVGFYALLAMGAVGLAVLFGVYWLAQNALEGLAALASSV
jgi:hypothetical protein